MFHNPICFCFFMFDYSCGYSKIKHKKKTETKFQKTIEKKEPNKKEKLITNRKFWMTMRTY
jgi:hypothetical protein